MLLYTEFSEKKTVMNKKFSSLNIIGVTGTNCGRSVSENTAGQLRSNLNHKCFDNNIIFFTVSFTLFPIIQTQNIYSKQLSNSMT